MKFTKMHGCGNDYVYINGFAEDVEDKAEFAVRVSDRHFGIGSDGVIFINPSRIADFEMEMYNMDGSRGEMCGNGIRCVAKYAYDYGLTDRTSISVETLGGIKYLDMKVEDGRVSSVRVDMGEPELKARAIPVEADTEEVIDQEIEVYGTVYRTTCVSMGNPHAVVFVDDIKRFPIGDIGPGFENHRRFPRRINAEFAHVLDKNTIEMRVWERGSGETMACGTGACAASVAAVLNGLTGNEVTVRLLGGDLFIQWDREKNRVYMSGPAVTVFDGELSL